MRISAKARYGIIAVLDIALHSEHGGGITAAEISERNNLSLKYIQQILAALSQCGIISSNRGFGGGYKLGKPADSIFLSDILMLFDSNFYRVNIKNEDSDSEIGYFLDKALWEKFDCVIDDFTENVSVADILADYESEAAGMFSVAANI